MDCTGQDKKLRGKERGLRSLCEECSLLSASEHLQVLETPAEKEKVCAAVPFNTSVTVTIHSMS